jgi:hypothetical protein
VIVHNPHGPHLFRVQANYTVSSAYHFFLVLITDINTNMADPFLNQHQWYDSQDQAITDMLQAETRDWPSLASHLDEALSDPALPRYYRASYHIMHVWHTREPALHIRWAREALDDMVQVLQAIGKPQDQLKPLWEMLAATEEAFESSKQGGEKYAVQIHSRVYSSC